MKTLHSIHYALLLIAVFFSTSALHSQTPATIQKLAVVTKLQNTIRVPQPTKQFRAQDTLSATMVIQLSDTSGIQKIHIKFGTTSGSGNLLTKAFVFDQSGTLPDQTIYTRKGRLLYLLMGHQYMGLNQFYAEAKLEYTGGQFSAVKTYSVQ